MSHVWRIVVLCLWTATAVAAAPREDISWRVDNDAISANGLTVLDGGDGAMAKTRRGQAACLAQKEDATSPAMYLYFDVDDVKAASIEEPAYVVIEYFDNTPGDIVQVEYDSIADDALRERRGANEDQQDVCGPNPLRDRYRVNEDQWGGLCTGSQKWRTSIHMLARPGFHNRQNLGADFRLAGASLFIRSVRLSRELPAEAEKLEADAPHDLKRLVEIGPGEQLIVGGFDPPTRESAHLHRHLLRGCLPALKELGVTSHEGYVRWNLCEPEPGRYDWSVYDGFVNLYKQYNLKWVPFLIAGSPYSLPDWYYKKPGSQGYVCLEHGKMSDVESLWNPALREHVARFIAAFCDHYRDSGVIESILLGVTGNFGEAIYVASSEDWTADIHGAYHTHWGFWAGDPFAVADLHRSLTERYGTIGALNAAWETGYSGFDAVKPFLRDDAPSPRAWLDFCQWYTDSMTEWSRFWLAETRAHFPKGDIYLCTGGDAPPELGADFGDQCKIAAEVGGGVRITNEGSDYATNYAQTHWVASAGQQYGAYYSFEPAGEANPSGVVARIYNATASGARGLHYYYSNLFPDEQARKNLIRCGKQLRRRTPFNEIAVYYPSTAITLGGDSYPFLREVQTLREYFDFAYRSDIQIRDGGLAGIKTLIILWGDVSESDTWNTIGDWVKNGGVLLYPRDLGPLKTVEGRSDVLDGLAASAAASDAGGRVIVCPDAPDSAVYRTFLCKQLVSDTRLAPITRQMVRADGVQNGLYVTATGPRELLWLNYTPNEVRMTGKTIGPYSITEQHFSQQ